MAIKRFANGLTLEVEKAWPSDATEYPAGVCPRDGLQTRIDAARTPGDPGTERGYCIHETALLGEEEALYRHTYVSLGTIT